MSHRTPDHYAALGVARTATQGQIRAAYRRLARELHPDTNADPKTAKRFARVSQAYEVLGDAARRKAWDERLTWGRFASPGTGGPSSVDIEGANAGSLYHGDLGHHSDFYQAGDPLTVAEAAVLVRRNPSWLRAAIRSGRLAATRQDGVYLLRRRDVERLDRTAALRAPKQAPPMEHEEEGASEA